MIEFSVQFFNELSFPAMLALFWYYFIFDFPRFVLSGLAVSIKVLFQEQKYFEQGTNVSVLVVGLSDVEGMRRTVHSLKSQTIDITDVVVVQDGTDVQMRDYAKIALSHGLISTYLETGIRGGKAAALNLGYEHCRNEAIVIADIDTSFDRDAIETIVANLLSESAIGAVSGNLGVRNVKASIWTGFQAFEYLSNISLGRQFLSMFGILTIVSGAFGAFRKSAIMSVGGWEVGPGDDSNLTTKIRRAGWKVTFEETAWALTDVPVSLPGLWRQRLRWNRSLVRVRLRKFRNIFDPRLKVFSLQEAVAALNQIWFNFIQTFSYFIFIVLAYLEYGRWVIGVILGLHFLILLTDIFEYILATLLVAREGNWRLFPYAIGSSVYIGIVMRVNRLQAYLSELIFRRSYQDTFYPKNVLDQQEQF